MSGLENLPQVADKCNGSFRAEIVRTDGSLQRTPRTNEKSQSKAIFSVISGFGLRDLCVKESESLGSERGFDGFDKLG